MTHVGKILEIKNVKIQFDGFQVLDGLDFAIDYGELRFLIGPNGAGKTTLLDIITGKTKPTSGQVLFDNGINLSHWSEHQIVQHGIGRKFQIPSIFASLTVFQNLETAIGFKTPARKLFRALSPEQQTKIEEILETVGLQDYSRNIAGTLSHGQKQWLEIGILLVQEPKLMLLDEPVAGMTRRERDHTGQLLQKIDGSRSILIVEHDMQFVRQFASVVTVLHMGKVLCQGSIDEVQNDPRVVEVYLGPNHQRVA